MVTFSVGRVSHDDDLNHNIIPVVGVVSYFTCP